jgi:hypothetical protein
VPENPLTRDYVSAGRFWDKTLGGIVHKCRILGSHGLRLVSVCKGRTVVGGYG